MGTASDVRSLLDGRLQLCFRGRRFGDASLCSPDVAARIRAGADALGVRRVVIMSLAFRHRVAGPGELVPSSFEGVERYLEPADGFLLDRPDTATYFANGDCAIAAIVAPSASVAVVMHLGLDCLLPPEGQPSLVAQAVRTLEAAGEAREQLQAWVGGAIGACCHGYDHAVPSNRARGERLRAEWGADVVGGEVVRGPRRGQVAYDHALVAERALRAEGLARVERDPTCTSCAGIDLERDQGSDGGVEGTWFSNTRDGAKPADRRTRGRNLVMIALGGRSA